MIKFLKRFAKKIERLNEVGVGITDGEHCNRNFCSGTIRNVEGCCTCHMGNPPCGYCTDAPHECDTCDWEE